MTTPLPSMDANSDNPLEASIAQLRNDESKMGYGTLVRISDGRTGMIVGRTTRGYRVNIDNSGGSVNRGRNLAGNGIERTFKRADLTVIPR